MNIVLAVMAVISAVFAGALWFDNRGLKRTAEAADKRARTPRLRVLIDYPSEAPIDRVICRLRLDGPEDLDSVTIYRPRTSDRTTYPIALTGSSRGWAADEVTFGPLGITQEVRFTLCCGAAEVLPEFPLRIECRSGRDSWVLPAVLPDPRGRIRRIAS